LGDLVLSDDFGHSLILKESFIDVWLLSFLGVISNICVGQSLKAEVLEEDYYVLVTRTNEALLLNYDGKEISVDPEKIIISLKDAAKEFINELAFYEGFDKNTALKALKEICA
jgi:hypothetical protein